MFPLSLQFSFMNIFSRYTYTETNMYKDVQWSFGHNNKTLETFKGTRKNELIKLNSDEGLKKD